LRVQPLVELNTCHSVAAPDYGSADRIFITDPEGHTALSGQLAVWLHLDSQGGDILDQAEDRSAVVIKQTHS
jgi:hypothetical protein